MVCLRLGLTSQNQKFINIAINKTLFSCLSHTKTSCQTVKSIRLLSTSILRPSITSERLYTSKHEWIQVSGNVGTIGISHYAQDSLGDVVFAQLPEAGTKVGKHDEVGALESVKAASELYSPVSGTVVEKNSSVEESPALINQSCYEKGWLFKVDLSNPEELKELFNEDQYQEFLKSDQEAHS